MPIKAEKTGFITTIYLNLSGASNETFEDFAKLFQEIYADKKARVVVLIFTEDESSNVNSEKSRKTLELVKNCPIPVIAAIKNSVSDFAFRLAEASHLCVAAIQLKPDLVNKIVPLGEVEKGAFALAEIIANLAPLAIRACLEAVTKGAEMPLEEGLKLESKLFARMFASYDMREGTRAFLEKRKPIFSGE